MNDPQQPRVSLLLKGKVEKWAHFSSRSIILRGRAGKKISSELVINQRPDYPFKVLNVTARYGRDIKYRLEKMTGSQSAGYILKVENLKDTPGRYFDTIYLQTDSSLHPKIGINVNGVILVPPKVPPKS